ncbi:MAG: DMT family transporter [Bacteroidetes bacterium]|nr:DMT family transporter [Bacteroidota bacterium]
MVLATLSFALMGAITKWLGDRYSSVELVFFRNLIGLIIIVISIINKPLVQIGGRFKLLVFRGTIGATSLFAFYYCLTKMQLAVANTYNLTYPLFIGFLSFFIFKKSLTFKEWLAIITGFAGVLFIFRPDMNYPLKYHLIGLYSGLGTSLGYLSIHYLGKFYDRRSILLSFLTGGLVLSCLSFLISFFYENAAFDFFLSPFIVPQGFDWILILLMAVIALIGQTFVTKAFSIGKPAVMGTLNFLQIPFSWLAGLYLGDSNFNLYTYIGILMVLFSGIWMSQRSNKG